MKKAIFLLLFIGTGIAAFSQVGKAVKYDAWETVGKIHNLAYTVAQLKKSPHDDAYVLVFKDERYPRLSEYEAVAFTATEEDLQNVVGYLNGGFKLKKGERIDFTLGDETVTVVKGAAGTVRFRITNGAFVSLSKGWIKQLFKV